MRWLNNGVDMKSELEKLVKAERKHKRELAELRALRQKHLAHKSPDQKVLAMIDDEVKKLLEG